MNAPAHAARTSWTRTVFWALIAAGLGFLAVFPAAVLGAVVAPLLGGEHRTSVSVAFGIWAWLAAVVAAGTAVALGLPVDRSQVMRAGLVAISGGLATAIGQWAMMAWAARRFGYFDLDYVGFAGLLPLPMTALTASATAWLLMDGRARLVAGTGAAAALVVLGALAADSVVGIMDGLGPWAWMLALTYLACSAYVGLVLAVVLTTWRQRLPRGGAGE